MAWLVSGFLEVPKSGVNVPFATTEICLGSVGAFLGSVVGQWRSGASFWTKHTGWRSDAHLGEVGTGSWHWVMAVV